jgi:hypothetical protein
VRGEVYAKSGAWGRIVGRTTSPRYFRVVICIDLGLALMLVAVF